MNAPRLHLKKKFMFVVSIVFLFLQLQGCQTPLIDVDLQVMPAGSCGQSTSDNSPGAGLCNEVGAAGYSAVNFVGIGGPNPVQSGTCSSGTKCNGGMCGWGKSCKNTYNYTGRVCDCICM